jgi:hypothetical protein
MTVDEASAFANTLARIRERYALYFYLPEGVQPGDERSVEVELSDAARRRYPGAKIHYRRFYLAPNESRDSEDTRPIRVSLPVPQTAYGGILLTDRKAQPTLAAAHNVRNSAKSRRCWPA